MKWLEAVKAYHSKKGSKFAIPKKGTAEYNEIKAMMGSSPAAAAAPAAKPKAAKAAAAMTADAAAVAAPVKRRAPRKAKADADKSSVVKAAIAIIKSPAKQADLGASAGDAKVIKRRAPRSAKIQLDVQPESVAVPNAPIKTKGRTTVKKVKEQSGSSTLEGDAINKTSLGVLKQVSVGAPSYAKQVQESITKGREVDNRAVDVDPSPPNMTVDNLTTDDAPAIDGEVAFSFNALKQRLGIN
jgi:hypothetical protein